MIKRWCDLVHLGLDWTATTLADVPKVSELLASEVQRVNEVLA
jgi:hypothetical protein